MQLPDLLCPIHSSQIQFLNLKGNIPKGQRTLCSKCNLIEPTDLEDSFKLWKNFQNSEKEKIQQQIIDQEKPFGILSKQISALHSKVNQQFQQINQIISEVQEKIKIENEGKITELIKFEAELNLTKLQEIASILSDQHVAENNNQFLQNLSRVHSAIVNKFSEIVTLEKEFLSQLQFEIIAAKRMSPADQKNIFVDYQLVKNIKQSENCSAIAFTFDNATMIAGCGNQIKLWKLEDENLFVSQTLTEHNGKILCLNSSNISYFFISGSEDKTIKCWKKQNGLWISEQTISGHNSSIFSLLLNNEDSLIISGGGAGDNQIKIWNATGQDWTQKQSLNRHKGTILAMSFNESQTQFVSCGNKDDKQMIIWEVVENEWKLLQIIQLEDKGFRVSFIDDNMIAWQQFQLGIMHIFELNEKNKQFQENKEISIKLNSYKDGQCFFPSIYNKQRRIFIQKHNKFVYIIAKSSENKFTLGSSLECESDFIYGGLTKNGQHLCLWDDRSEELKLIRLNYK